MVGGGAGGVWGGGGWFLTCTYSSPLSVINVDERGDDAAVPVHVFFMKRDWTTGWGGGQETAAETTQTHSNINIQSENG